MKFRVVSWLAAAAMLGVAALANFWHPVPMARSGFQLEAVIPAQFGGWKVDSSVTPVAPSPDVQANLDKLYGQIVSRTYVNAAGARVMLVVAYGGDQSDSLKVHRQEVCYAAQGFTVKGVRRDRLELPGSQVPLVRMQTQKGSRFEPVSYWFTMGDHVVIGRAERLLTQIRYGLAGEIPDGLLVRVSSLSRDTAAGYAAHDDFMRELLRAVGPDARLMLAGLGA